MLLDSVDQGLGKCIVWTAYLCSTKSETSAGKWGGDSIAGGWNHLKASTLTGLAVDVGCWLGTQQRLLVQTPIQGLSVWVLGFSRMVAGFHDSVSQKAGIGSWEFPKILAQKLAQHHFLCLLLVKAVTSSSQIQKQGTQTSQPNGRMSISWCNKSMWGGVYGGGHLRKIQSTTAIIIINVMA